MTNIFYIFIFLVLFCSSKSYASDIPSSSDAGRLIEQKKSFEFPEDNNLIKESSEEEIIILPKEEAVEFTLNEVLINGISKYEENNFLELYSQKIGTVITLEDAYEWANIIRKTYHNDGYIFTQVSSPILEEGKILINVREIKLGKISVEGSDNQTIKEMANNISEDFLANIKLIERYILLINDLPGVSAKVILKPLDNIINIVVLVSEKQESLTDLNINNYGSRYNGPIQTSVNTSITNNEIPESRTSAGLSTSIPFSELQSAQIGQSYVINSEGTNINLDIAAANINPGYNLSSQDIESESFLLNLSLSHPILRSREDNLYFQSGLSLKNVSTKILKSELYNDKIINADFIFYGSYYDGFSGRNKASISLKKGLDFAGASEEGELNLSRASANPQATTFIASLERLQSLNNSFSFYSGFEGQLSDSELLSSEQFGYGGQEFGSAYDFSEFIADNGISGKIELIYNDLIIYEVSTQFFIFTDIGQLWNHQERDNAITAASSGVGIRFINNSGFSAQLTISQPLLRPVDSPGFGSGYFPRAFFSINYSF